MTLPAPETTAFSQPPAPFQGADTDLARRLLNDFQRDFPLQPRPFETVASRLGVTEAAALDALSGLQKTGAVSRVGPVFRPHALGASTLAAMAVPPGRLEDVAALVSGYSAVNHNYEREHRINLWFVLTASDTAQLATVVADIQRQTGLEVLCLPMVADYHIDLGFDMANRPASVVRDRNAAGAVSSPVPTRAIAPRPRLVSAIQGGLPLVTRPFRAVGLQAGLDEHQVIENVAAMVSTGIIKRFGVVVRHHELGYRCNAMVVWDVADERADALGAQMSRYPFVTLCYRRTRRLPVWPYNLFCMIHGRDRATVRHQLAELTEGCGATNLRRDVLFSGRRFKQRGARYGGPGPGTHCAA